MPFIRKYLHFVFLGLSLYFFYKAGGSIKTPVFEVTMGAAYFITAFFMSQAARELARKIN